MWCRTPPLLAPALALAFASGCPKKTAEPDREERLTTAEAREALEESANADQAMRVTGGTIEITTSFTIGGAVEAAAQELADFYASQLACAEVTVSGATLTVEYGANGTCTHRGQSYTGTHSVTVSRNDDSDVVVSHTWDRLSNGVVEVSGDAEVTWSLDDPSRHVVHELRWTSLRDGREGTGTGDRVQRPLAGGIEEGFSVDGGRTWRGAAGTWQLDIEAVEMRWVDPIPQSGRYVLETPKGRSIELSFTRLDDDTIRATLASGDRSFSYEVTSAGVADAS
jgi:hypothetical protein